MKPLVVELAPPDGADQPAPGAKRAADVAQRLHRIGEEHQPHPRERVVVWALQVSDLDVGREKLDVLHAGLGCLRDRGPDERLGYVDSHCLTVRPNQARELLRRVAEAAPYVDHAVPGLGG